jgi:hypothetical protein
LAEEDVPKAHVHLGSHVDPYQEVMARRACVSKRQEEPKRLEGGLNKVWGAKLGNALNDEDLQVLRCRERSTCHQVDDILVALREAGVTTVALYRMDGGVHVHDERARVGLPFATTKVCNLQYFFPCLEAERREEPAPSGRDKASATRQRAGLRSAL